MVTSRVKINSIGLKYLGQDIRKSTRKLTRMTQWQLNQIVRDTGNYYVKTYNAFHKQEGHPSLAKATVKHNRGKSLTSARKTYEIASTITIPRKSDAYDVGKSHYVSLKHASMRAWVKKKWLYSKKSGWSATRNLSKKSNVFGSRTRPMGAIYFRSHKDKWNWSIKEQSAKLAEQHFLKLVINKLGRKVTYGATNHFKKEYKVYISITI